MPVWRVIGTVVGGLADWLLRLLFVATVVAGGYGAYIAWFGSLGQGAPGHDRLTGTIIMGIALGVSLLAWLGLVCVRFLQNPEGNAWYMGTYAVFAALFITVVLPLSSALRGIGTWERTNTLVTATASGCYDDNTGDGNGDAYYCDLSWSVNGHDVSQWRETHGVYPDGTAIALWVDPNTGGADDHDWVPVMWSFLAFAFGLGVSAAAIGVTGMVISDSYQGPGEWLHQLAWWNRLPKRPAPPPRPASKPAAEPEINDAIPIQYQTDIQDKRP